MEIMKEKSNITKELIKIKKKIIIKNAFSFG